MRRKDAPAALLFDVFGTLVDWRSSIITELEAFGASRAIAADWAALVDDWRAAYVPSMDRVRRGELPWLNLDALHRASLDVLLDRYGIAGVGVLEREMLARAWHRLTPWPDVVAGLHRLRDRFIIASLSNGNVALQIDVCRYAGLPFNMLFSAELFGHYKPDPQTYLGACALLDLPAERVMLVAAHADDLLAAQALGLHTAFVARPTEYGPSRNTDETAASRFDYAVSELGALAAQFAE
jgi:2-haloacid dehalogenase